MPIPLRKPIGHSIEDHDGCVVTGAQVTELAGGGETSLHSHATSGVDVKCGTVNVVEASTATVTFNTAFASTPVVVCTVQDASGEENGLTITAVSTTQFTVQMEKVGGGAADTFTVGWIATNAGDP